MLSECIYMSGGGVSNVEFGTCTIAGDATVTTSKKPIFFVIANDNNKEYRVYDNRQGNEVLYSTLSTNSWGSGYVYPRSNPGITYDNDKTFTIKVLSGTATSGTGWWMAIYDS